MCLGRRAWTGEPVATRTTRQAGPATLDLLLAAAGPWWHPDAGLLELARSERVIARRAILTGARSGVPYLLAESLVVPGRLPATWADVLKMHREVLQITAVRAGDAADFLGVASSARLARRTCRIVIRGRAAAAVTEWRPIGRLAACLLAPAQKSCRQSLNGVPWNTSTLTAALPSGEMSAWSSPEYCSTSSLPPLAIERTRRPALKIELADSFDSYDRGVPASEMLFVMAKQERAAATSSSWHRRVPTD